MNIINRIKLQTQYSDLEKLGVDSNLVEKIINDRKFAELYRRDIKPFIKYLQNYSYEDYIDGTFVEKKLDLETIRYHINSILKIYNGNNSIKYIPFIKENSLEKEKLYNLKVLNDYNFDDLFKLINYQVFSDNIVSIIDDGYSDRLLKLIENNPKRILSVINSNIFKDNVWNIIKSNPKFGDKTILDIFGSTTSSINVLINIINQGLFEGLKYTYENIPESKSFIEHSIFQKKEDVLSYKQFDLDFIKNIGNFVLGRLYYRSCFFYENEYSKIFKIYQSGNYELIQDIVNYDTNGFHFDNISDEDINKDLLNIGIYNKKEALLNMCFGMKIGDSEYIKIFLSTIEKAQLIEEFQKKYGTILDLLNQILNASDEEIMDISKTITKEARKEYKKLFNTFEKDGNELIKAEFCGDLKKRNSELLSVANHIPLREKNGKTIDVYEFTGQPFTMLVHNIFDNKKSRNNEYVSQIVNNPEKWNSINHGNNHISTSLISDKYMVTYGIPDNDRTLMFGFYNIPVNLLKFTAVYDAGIDRNAKTDINYNMRNRHDKININTIVSIDELIQKTIEANIHEQPVDRMWNEVVLTRVNEETGKKLQPDYIVCMDYISENSKKAAMYFGIPIYLIERKYYKEVPYEPWNNMIDQAQEEYGSTGMHR